MKILWITNCEPGKIATYFKRNNNFASWINYSHELLAMNDEIELFVLSCGIRYEWLFYDGINYAGFGGISDFNEVFEKTLEAIKPDIVHVWGTEYEHFLEATNIMEKNNCLDRLVVSIQGLVSVIDQYYCFNLPRKVCKRKTFYERFRFTSIEDAHRALHERGLLEKQALKKVKYCIGRTDWDRAITKQYNRSITYYSCNEILRQSFYEHRWKYDKCEKHSIVFSQSGYILKGFHVLLDALVIVKQFYPDVKVYAVGKSPFNYENFIDRIKRYSYLEYLGEKIKEKGLIENVEFVGFLDEEQMVRHYQRGNVFVCSSGIENSSNSVAEAMILGMPIVASDVGGIKTFISHNINGILYQADSTNMLADGIMRIFEDETRAVDMGDHARKDAYRKFDPQRNTQLLIGIYKQMLSCN